MSLPANPLDKFRSYAYHHILIAADSTEAMRALTDPTLSSDQQQDLFADLKLGEKIPVNGSATAGFFVICDTRQNSYFSINEISYASTLSAGKASMSGTVTGLININMVDPSGVSFLNYIKYITADALKISIHNVIFLLKTIFIGHTDDGRTETVYQNAISMSLVDLMVAPSHHGAGIYAKFAPLNNGAVVYMKDYSKIFDLPGIHSKSNRLSDAIKSLEDTLNSKSRNWYKQLQLEVVKGAKIKGEEPAKGYGKLVQYMLTVPDDWESFKVLGVFDEMTESKFKKGGKRDNVEAKGVFIGLHTKPETTILEVLESILKQSNEVQKLASNDARKEKLLKGYKILTNLTSDDDTVTVHYDIINYAIPNQTNDSGKKEGADEVDKTPPLKMTENGKIEFDYIYSGKNTDIINFEMKLNNVNLFMGDNLAIGDKAAKEATKDQKDTTNDEADTGKKTLIINVKEKDPICPPAKSGSQQNNMSWVTETDARQDAVKNRQQFIYNMSMAHGTSSFNVVLKIRGNPDLYQKFVDADIPPHVKLIDNIDDVKYITDNEAFVKGTNSNYLSQNDVQEYKKFVNDVLEKKSAVELNNQATKTPSLYPFYVKINIFGQDYDVLDNSYGSFSQFKPFQRMWYNGYYVVFKIEHRFVNGEFYQELLLGSVPMDLYGQTEADTNKSDKTTDTANVEKKEETKKEEENFVVELAPGP